MKPINEKKNFSFCLSWLSGMNGEWFAAHSIKKTSFFNFVRVGYKFSSRQTHSFIHTSTNSFNYFILYYSLLAPFHSFFVVGWAPHQKNEWKRERGLVFSWLAEQPLQIDEINLCFPPPLKRNKVIQFIS